MTTPTKLPNPAYGNRGKNLFPQIKCFGSASVTPGALTTLTTTSGTITVLGAALGDYVMASYGATLGGCILDVYVSDGDTVTWVITNPTSGTLTPAAATTLRVVVFYVNEGTVAT